VRGLERVAAGVVTGCDASDHRPIWVTLQDHEPEGRTPPVV
jgi:hypothetical protein